MSLAKSIGLLTVSSLALGALVDDASAQDDGASAPRATDIIIVTARKKEESIQDAPLAVSAISGAQLEAAGIDSFDQVLSTIPNAGQSGGIAGSLQGLVSIRGISTLVRFAGLETGVGFYVDGVYTGRPEMFNQELIDIERIEVLRGPQGAIFGKNTIAGAINILTEVPDDTVKATVEGQYGNYDHMRVRGNISGPLIKGKLAGSLSAGYYQRDGYVDNVSLIGPDLESADVATFRGKLNFTPNERVSLLLSADGLIDRGDPVFFETTDVAFVDDPTEQTPFTVNQDQPNFLDRDIWGVSLTSNVEFGNGDWTTILAYRDASFDASIDDDKLPFRFFVDFFGSDTQFFSAETRYAASWGDKIDYLVGLYYFNQKVDNLSNFALGEFLTGVPGVEPPINLTSEVDSRSIAAFFNVDYAISDRLTLGVGGRYVREEKDATHVQEDFTGIFGSTDFSRNRTDDDFAPTISLSYDVSEYVTTYARFAQGFKSAGFNTDFIAEGVSNLEVAPEFATSYEIGVKSSLADGKLLLNVAGFYTDYKDLQLAQIIGAGVSLSNASSAEIYGVEADFAAALGDYVDVTGSLGYLDATYDDFPGCPSPGAAMVPTVDNCAGNVLNLAPKWTAAFSAQFTYPLEGIGNFIARADWNYRGDVFFEPQNTERLSGESRNLLNGRIGLSADRWDVFAWANNITNEVYVNFADDRSAIAIPTTAAYGAPRTYGVTVRLRY